MPYRDLFDDLEPSERVRLLSKAATNHYAPGKFLIREAQSNHTIFVLLEGTVRVTQALKHTDNAKELATLGLGDILGEMSFLTREPASASVIAVTEVDAICLSHEDIREFILEEPGFAGRFYRSLAILLAHRLATTSKQFNPVGDSLSDGDTP